ncbi:MAG: hypothetical protein ACYTEQ_31355 [Planctomycetota bacterium]|jgi:hypothetical protein
MTESEWKKLRAEIKSGGSAFCYYGYSEEDAGKQAKFSRHTAVMHMHDAEANFLGCGRIHRKLARVRHEIADLQSEYCGLFRELSNATSRVHLEDDDD